MNSNQLSELQTELDRMVDDGAIIETNTDGETKYELPPEDDYVDDDAYTDAVLDHILTQYPDITRIVQ